MSKEDGNNEELVFNVGRTINGYKLVSKIDEGGFGQVFKCSKNDKFYAMKLESNSQEGGSAIKLEVNVLSKLDGSVFPKFISGGKRRKYHYLVLELLGDSLKTLKTRSPNPDVWSDGTWSRVAIQCLFALKTMHNKGFVHRDVKPSNFAIGINTPTEVRSRVILLFDFGLARKFVEEIKPKKKTKPIVQTVAEEEPVMGSTEKLKPGKSKSKLTNVEKQKDDRMKTAKLAPPKPAATSQLRTDATSTITGYRICRRHTDFRGTHQYASPNAHALIELGRQDDIWSLMYMAAEMIIELPWTNNDDVPVETLKYQSSIPRLFTDPKTPNRLTPDMFSKLNQIDKMLNTGHYYQHPDYQLVYEFFLSVMQKSGVNWNSLYDWEKKAEELTKEQKKAKRGLWEDPKDFFVKDPWSHLPRPIVYSAPSRNQSKRIAEKPGKRSKKSMVSKEDASCAADEPQDDVKTPVQTPQTPKQDEKPVQKSSETAKMSKKEN